jgi:flagellar hook assembly protein FlgD
LTPTITLTPVPFPYILTIEVYNEAGEKIILLTNERMADSITDVKLIANGQEWGAFNPTEGPLIIRISGIQTVNHTGEKYVDFEWNGLNSNGQGIKQGVYFIKISYKDTYGCEITHTYDVQVLKIEEYVQLSIYNTAGELVRRITKPEVRNAVINLAIDDVILVGKEGGDEVRFNYGNGEIEWDGKNEFGRLVDSGTYEIKVEVKTGTGFTTIATKTVSIINAGGNGILGIIKVVPNPYIIDNLARKDIRIIWSERKAGEVKVMIYNMAGDLVRVIREDMDRGEIGWDMKTSTGQSVSTGVYVGIVEGIDKATGKMQREKKKIVIMRKVGEE